MGPASHHNFGLSHAFKTAFAPAYTSIGVFVCVTIRYICSSIDLVCWLVSIRRQSVMRQWP